MLQITNAPIDQLFALALQHHQAGRLADAELLYRNILEQQPTHADALHLLGVLACQANQYPTAMELIAKAIAINPRFAAYHSNLGEAYRRAGQFEPAAASYRRALALDPHFADAYINLGTSMVAMAREEAAREVFAAGVRECPTVAQLHRHLADVSVRLRQFDQAIESYHNALRLDPLLNEAQFNLGGLLLAQGRPLDAAEAYQALVTRTPDDLAAHYSLAQALARGGKPNEAYKVFAAILQRDPRHAGALEGLGNLYQNSDKFAEAIRHYRLALEAKPGDGTITANLAFALRDFMQIDEAVESLRAAVRAEPNRAPLHSALIFTMLLHPHLEPREIEAEQERWNQSHVAPLSWARRPHANDRAPDRRLKVGYVSADFRQHPVGRFMTPLLTNHDRSQVEIFCYSSCLRSDAATDILREKSDHWRQVSAMDDDELARLVRTDAIDILVDLSMHSIDNRLWAFARKPAPVQITYLAYCGGTGLHTIDYRLTDRQIDPLPSPGDGKVEAPGASHSFEKPLHLETYWCYGPPSNAGDVAPLPLKSAGRVTFGSFNFFSKVNTGVLDAWARLLCDLPESRLILHVPAGGRRALVHAHFERAGVSADRVILAPRLPEDKYFQQYGLVDLALDPFPFTGGTTTCDALWMGVPVVTLAGPTTMSRGSASILSAIGLPELIAHTPEEYHRIALELASNKNRLDALRGTMRRRMQESPLMDAPRFVRSLERAYRIAWHTWCKGGHESPAPPKA